jgi:Asp-tRNA(Asn)/Glu-tRNA(Gln) amidotransferase A subunit family amidase
MTEFNIVEASIKDHQDALTSGLVTSVELVVKYLIRIGTYDIRGGLNAFTVFNDKVLDEARASDDRRASGQVIGPLDGIPYTLKDSYKYAGLSVTNGSPTLAGLMSSEDSYVASKFRSAGAVLIGKTNMPPMAAGGMQRGLYGRAENPYNRQYLTAAFSSGSSNGAATSLASSMAAFGMASETVSSGRSPASNNSLIAYTPSKGLISCRGLWPLYVTCDVPVPFARSIEDMVEVLEVIAQPDPQTAGDFWRDQPYVELPLGKKLEYRQALNSKSLAGKRIAVPKRYIGGQDSHPHAKPSVVSKAVVGLWQQARADLESLGAEVVETDFPLVSNYEDDSKSGEANNVDGAPAWWNSYERGALVAKAWDEFLIANKDTRLSDITKVDPNILFPKPEGYVPDIFLEHRNWINYAGLPAMANEYKGKSIYELSGMEQTLRALEAQRKRDLDEWLDSNNLDFIVFPSAGDVGRADLEFDAESAKQALQNGVKYSNGNRSLRHLGVPTVSVPMGLLDDSSMPMNLTFAGKAYSDDKLMQYAYAYEQKTKIRVPPPSTPALSTDTSTSAMGPAVSGHRFSNVTVKNTEEAGQVTFNIEGVITGNSSELEIQIYLDGTLAASTPTADGAWEVAAKYEPHTNRRLSWDLKPMEAGPVMVLSLATTQGRIACADLQWLR